MRGVVIHKRYFHLFYKAFATHDKQFWKKITRIKNLKAVLMTVLMLAFYSMTLRKTKKHRRNNVQNKMNYLADFFGHCPCVLIYCRYVGRSVCEDPCSFLVHTRKPSHFGCFQKQRYLHSLKMFFCVSIQCQSRLLCVFQ